MRKTTTWIVCLACGLVAFASAPAAMVDEDGNVTRSVRDGEGEFYAGFGSSDVNVEGKYGVKGNALSPGILILCPDLDFRLLAAVARGRIQATVRGSSGRST